MGTTKERRQVTHEDLMGALAYAAKGDVFRAVRIDEPFVVEIAGGLRDGAPGTWVCESWDKANHFDPELVADEQFDKVFQRVCCGACGLGKEQPAKRDPAVVQRSYNARGVVCLALLQVTVFMSKAVETLVDVIIKDGDSREALESVAASASRLPSIIRRRLPPLTQGQAAEEADTEDRGSV
jgi:hypothetical protein